MEEPSSAQSVTEPPAILVVEDEPAVRNICERVLRRCGYRVAIAEHGLAALEHLRTATFDLVLTDIEMPKMSGMQLLQELRQNYPDTEVIIFTAYATVETARDALRQGAFDYLHKPQIVDDLERTVERALEWRRVRMEKKRLSEIIALYDLSQTFTSTLDIGQAIEAISQLIWRRFAPQALSLTLLHREEHQLELLAQQGEPRATEPGQRIAVDSYDEAAILRGHQELVGEHTAPGPAYLASLLLRTGDRPIGLLRLTRGNRQLAFSADERTMLTVAASQIAASLENIRLYQQVKEQNLQIIQAFATALDARDPYTLGHSEQVMRYSVRLAEILEFAPQQIERIRYGALLHDVGKIGIRDYILLKPGPLTAAEFSIMQQHPHIGANILNHIKSLSNVIPMIRCHHERIDGTGYPDHRSGLDIPVEARIISIADAYDAMTSDRAYRKAMQPEAALQVLLRGRNTHWDGELVDAFVKLMHTEGPQLTLPPGRPTQETLLKQVPNPLEARD
jgi:putative nucleotidyltransferase with HDIG domain